MIARSIPTPKSSSGFKQLAAYVLNEKDRGKGDPVDWKLAEYILDQDNAGEKVASHRITNCVSDEPGWAVKECLALAAQNTRSTKDKSYHLVISFPPGERPTEAQMIDIEDTMVKAIGFEGHRRISAVHQDKAHWHMHVAIVTVHPKTLRNVTPYYDKLRQQEACIALEIKHGLTRTRHTPSPEHALNGRASALEAYAGKISFARWITDNAAASLTASVVTARNWAEVHAAMADYGVELKPRGAGLVIANQGDARSIMKASAIDRSLSFKALTDRFGPIEAASPSGKEPKMRYVGQPHSAEPSLWAKYQQERQNALGVRTAAMATLRAGHLKHTQDMNDWYRKRQAAAKAAHLNRGDQISTRHVLDKEFKADQAKRRVREAEERKALRSEHKVPTWEGFLAQQAGRGDQQALKALERRVDAHMISGAGAERGGRD